MELLKMSPEEVLAHDFKPGQLTPYQEITKTTYAGRIRRKHLFILDNKRRKEDWISGDMAYDTNAMNAITDAWLTIEHMLAVFDDEGYLVLKDPSMKKRIYQILTLHMKCCKLHNSNVLELTNVSTVTLDLMDRFCDSIFDGARWELSQTDDNDDARTRFNKEFGLISTKTDDETLISGKRTPIFNAEEFKDDFMKSGVREENDDCGFGDDEWI